MEDIHYQFFLKLIPVSFTFNDGESGRTHIGVILQDVESAMEEPVLDENGNPEYIYSLRYEEFIGLITHALQKND